MKIQDTSQYGEGQFLIDYFDGCGIFSGLLVDIGAKTKSRSNSYNLIHDRNWYGVLVEPHPESFKQLQIDFVDALARVEFQRVAISDFEGVMDFYLHDTPGHSSLIFREVSGELNEMNRGQTSVGRPILVPVIRIEILFNLYGVPRDLDLLCIDAEGSDYKILADMLLNTRIRPGVIVFEAHTHRGILFEETQIVKQKLITAGYGLIHTTVANEIWERR